MKRKTVIITISILIIVLAIAAGITVTLIFTLKKSDNPSPPADSGPTLDDIISDNSTFPNGSYSISANALIPDLPALAPLSVNITDLTSLGLVVDNSSFVAETNRLSYFFIRLPAVNNNNTRIKRDIVDDNEEAIGIRFGNADTIHIVPLNLTQADNSGLSYVGSLPDSSHVYQLQVRMSNAMCSGSSVGSCSSVSWTPYSISSATSGSRANFDNTLPVACGSQCNADANSPCATSCDICDGIQVYGYDTPVTRRYKMGTFAVQNLNFYYETFTVPDRMTVNYEGSPIFDSGCLGTEGERLTPINYTGNSLEVRVDVEPNCQGTTGTAWYFQMNCPACSGCAEYRCLDDSKAHCGQDGYLINYGWWYCDRYYQYYANFTPAGQKFIDCVRVKLLNFMENYLSNVHGNVDCADLETQAFASHIPAYYQCGFCEVLCDNIGAFWDVLWPAAYIWQTWTGGCQELINCVAAAQPNNTIGTTACLHALGTLVCTPVIIG